MNVLVVDDHPMMREAIRTYIDSADDMTCIGEASTGEGAIAAVEQLRPDVVVMDIQLPRLDGIQATDEIIRKFPKTAVLAVTTFNTEHHAVRVLRAGARGYIVKDAYAHEIITAIRDVASGGIALSPQIAKDLVVDVSQDDQSIRKALEEYSEVPEVPESQLAVLKLLGRGYSNAEIAKELYLAEDTVKKYLSRLNERFGTRDRVQLLIRAVQLGFVRP